MNRGRVVIAYLGTLAVGGLVAIGGTAVAAPGDPVVFGSDELRDCVNASSVPAKPAETAVTEGQAATVIRLVCTDGTFTDLSGIESLTAVETIDISRGALIDLTPFDQLGTVTEIQAVDMHQTLPRIPVGQAQDNPIVPPGALPDDWFWPWAGPALNASDVSFGDRNRTWAFTAGHTATAGEHTFEWNAEQTPGPGNPRYFYFSGYLTQTAISAPAVQAQPAFASPVMIGASATLEASATSNEAPTVQWQSRTPGGEWAPIAGATATTLDVDDVQREQSGTEFRAVFTNFGGTTPSEAATLAVVGEAEYTSHPAEQATTVDGSVEFRAEFSSDSDAPDFTWEFSDDDGATWQDASDLGEPEAPGPRARAAGWYTTLTLTGIPQEMNGYLFRAVIADEYTAVAIPSDAARLTVTAAGVNPAPVPGETSTAGRTGGAAPSATPKTSGSNLAWTGSTVLPIVLGAVALTGIGGGVLVMRRRKTV